MKITSSAADSNMTEQQQEDFRNNIGAGGGVLLDTQTVSAVASVAIDLSGNYSRFQVVGEGLFASSSVNLELRFSGDSGASDYSWVGTEQNSGGLSAAYDDSDDSIRVGRVYTTQNGKGILTVDISMLSASNYSTIESKSTSYASATIMSKGTYSGARLALQADTSATIVAGGINITGTFKVYGYK